MRKPQGTQVKVDSLIGEEEGQRGSRQALYEVQTMLIHVLNILPFQIKERVASDTIIFDPNLHVILMSFASCT